MNTITFGRDKTQILKGIALLLMLIHHTSNPSYWSERGTSLYSYFEHQVASTKMCVYIFAFLVGYGFFCSKNKTLKYSLKRILLLIVPFWTMLFCMFIPAAYASGEFYDVLDCNAIGSKNGIVELFYNMFGFVETLNWYSWFVGFYCFSMLLMPALHKFFQKFQCFGWLIAIIGFYILAVGIHSIRDWDTMPIVHMMFITCTLIPLIIVGYMCAMWNVQGKIPTWFEGREHIPLALLTIAAVLVINAFRIYTAGFCIQAFYTPLLIFAIVGIFNSINVKWLSKGLMQVGDISMYMWFFHAIFFTESVNLYTKRLVFSPIHSYLYTLFMTFVLTYIGSWIIKKIISPILNVIK
ncbi:acyltransferase family protein [Bacteroides acidifaciens]|uniref:acyltransferase family protein n=1 Tax=Bacteroides acidifaciens TaxID=85831 RepID=UPI00158F4230|nr:acyltransferase family protein [Bacteroides acidifaciens]